MSSLSSGSISLLQEINEPVEIDAFLSPPEDMPEQYVQTRINLLTALGAKLTEKAKWFPSV